MSIRPVDEDIPEPDIEGWEPTKLPREIKIEARREIHWFYWLSGKNYEQIATITGWNRTTIYEDLRWVQRNLGSHPQTMEAIRQQALMNLHLTRAEVKDAARHILEKAESGADYTAAAKLFQVSADIDAHILTRYTQTGGETTDIKVSELDSRVKILIAWIKHKLGPEGLDGFENFYEQQLRLSEIKKVQSVAEA